MKLILGLSASLLLLASCRTSTKLPLMVLMDEFSVEVREDWEQRHFVLSFHSFSKEPLCIQYEQWPRGGKFPDAQGSVYVKVAEQKYWYIREHNFGYCPTGCSYEVKPGASLEAVVDFQEFPEEAFRNIEDHRELVVTVVPLYCK